MHDSHVVIQIKDLTKVYKTLNRREGLIGSFKDIFSKDYNDFVAVDQISMEVHRGDIVGYLGPNGAGKSTTIKMMTGVIEPTAGIINVNGRQPYKNRIQNARDIGVVFGQRSQLWWALPVIESFKILKEIYRIADKEYQEILDLYQSLVDINSLLLKPVRQMSLGQRTLCDILAAFLHSPSIVFLDEPTIGLDVSMKLKIRNLIKELNREKNTTVILTTHDIGDVEVLCNLVVIIHRGKIIYNNNIEKLREYYGKVRMLKILLKDEVNNDILEIIKLELMQYQPLLNVQKIVLEEKWINIVVEEDRYSLMDLITFLQKKFEIVNIKIEEVSLEEVIKRIYEDGRD